MDSLKESGYALGFIAAATYGLNPLFGVAIDG